MSTWVRQMEFAASAGPMWGTILFVALFIGTLVWIFRPGSNRHYDHQSHLPLEDEASRSTDAETRHG